MDNLAWRKVCARETLVPHRYHKTPDMRARSLTFCAHLPLVLQIAFVADDDDGKVVFILDS